MDAITKPTMKADHGARSNAIALPASELPANWYNVLPDQGDPSEAIASALRALPEVRP